MKRMYGLFERARGARGQRWERCPGRALPKPQAILFYQSRLLAPLLQGLPIERALRPVKDETPPRPVQKCDICGVNPAPGPALVAYGLETYACDQCRHLKEDCR